MRTNPGSGASPTIVTSGPPLELVRALCRSLEAEAVAYCHWKSNAFLARSASGENDLDLLVRRSDAARFNAVLGRLGFKQTLEATPGVSHYYGCDDSARRLVHVHAHIRLVAGDDATKNYVIPLEEALLSQSRREGLFFVPPPELELVVFVARMVLKHCPWDAIVARQGRLRASERQELQWLLEQVDPTVLEPRSLDGPPFTSRALFEQCLNALDARSGLRERVEAGKLLHASLKPFARRSRVADAALKLWRRGVALVRRRLGGRVQRGRQLASGGAVIALVGGDGSGKSTLVRELEGWLSRDLSATTIHFGKPPRSAMTAAVRGTLALRRRALPAPRGPSTGPGAAPEGFLPSLLAVCVARDRHRAYRRARRLAESGMLVICDRFPLPGILSMDGPKLTDPAKGRLSTALASRERGYLERFAPPDVLIVLGVEPDIAVERRPDEPAQFVRARAQQILDADWAELPAGFVDAGRPLADVVSEVRALVWESL